MENLPVSSHLGSLTYNSSKICFHGDSRTLFTKPCYAIGLGCRLGNSGTIRGTFLILSLLFADDNSDLSAIMQDRIQMEKCKFDW